MGVSYLAERSLGTAEEDVLGFDVYAGALSETIDQLQPPQTVGVVGDWGSGKTSLLTLTRAKLAEASPDIKTVWFDSWKYNSSENLLLPLIRAIEKQTGAKKSSNVLQTSAFVVYNALAGALKDRTGIAFGTEDMKAAKDMAESSQRISLKWVDEVDRLRDDIASFVQDTLAQSNAKKLCVFIDDLDRCGPIVAIDLLENIRIHFEVPGVVFVLGISLQVIDEGVRAKYGDIPAHSRTFLDKLVFLKFPVPPAEARIESLVQRTLEAMLQDVDSEISEGGKTLAAACRSAFLTNPRTVKMLTGKLVLIRNIAKAGKLALPEDLPYALVAKELVPGFLNSYAEQSNLLGEGLTWLAGGRGNRVTPAVDEAMAEHAPKLQHLRDFIKGWLAINQDKGLFAKGLQDDTLAKKRLLAMI